MQIIRRFVEAGPEGILAWEAIRRAVLPGVLPDQLEWEIWEPGPTGKLFPGESIRYYTPRKENPALIFDIMIIPPQDMDSEDNLDTSFKWSVKREKEKVKL